MHGDHATPDLNWRELAAVIPMVVFMIWIGIQPMNFMKMSERTMYQMSDDLLKMKQGGVVAGNLTQSYRPVILSGVFRSGGKEDATKDLVAITRTRDSSLRKPSLRSALLRSE